MIRTLLCLWLNWKSNVFYLTLLRNSNFYLFTYELFDLFLRADNFKFWWNFSVVAFVSCFFKKNYGLLRGSWNHFFYLVGFELGQRCIIYSKSQNIVKYSNSCRVWSQTSPRPNHQLQIYWWGFRVFHMHLGFLHQNSEIIMDDSTGYQ